MSVQNVLAPVSQHTQMLFRCETGSYSYLNVKIGKRETHQQAGGIVMVT